MAATVASRLAHDRMVNLSVVDHAGAQFRRIACALLQEDDPTPHSSEGPYASGCRIRRVKPRRPNRPSAPVAASGGSSRGQRRMVA